MKMPMMTPPGGGIKAVGAHGVKPRLKLQRLKLSGKSAFPAGPAAFDPANAAPGGASAFPPGDGGMGAAGGDTGQ
jgi:hypothetical protein